MDFSFLEEPTNISSTATEKTNMQSFLQGVLSILTGDITKLIDCAIINVV